MKFTQFEIWNANAVYILDTEGDDIVVANIDATTDRHGAGSFEFNVDFYTDSTYETQSAASDVITVGEQVYFGVSAKNLPSSVSFSIMDCTVTNTNGADLSYYIVENFCPDIYTRTNFGGENMQKDSVFLHYQGTFIKYPKKLRIKTIFSFQIHRC